MAPQLMPGDVLLVDTAFKVECLKRGDVAVFRRSMNEQVVAHRVIGCARTFEGIRTKGDRNWNEDAKGSYREFIGKGVYRIRDRKKTRLSQRHFYFLMNYYNLFPGQRLPACLKKSHFKHWFRL